MLFFNITTSIRETVIISRGTVREITKQTGKKSFSTEHQKCILLVNNGIK